MKKYELIKESKTIFKGREVFRVKALKNFGNVKAGVIGGWVCSENNLSQYGYCWIYGNAKVIDSAKMYDDARMYGNARMCDNARMFDNARMRDNAKMYGNAKVRGSGIIGGNAEVRDVIIYGNVYNKFKKIFQHICEKRILISILTEDNRILYNIGRQVEITKEEFIDRIYNDCEVRGKGLEEYPHRQEYLDMIDIAESYLKKFI